MGNNNDASGKLDMPLISTYVENLDKSFGGGIPKGHIVLIAGTPGTMKSTLSYHILSRNATEKGIKGLYITLEERGRQISDTMRQHGFTTDPTLVTMGDLTSLRESKKSIEEEIDWFGLLRKYIKKRAEGESEIIIVIDSINALYSLCDLPSVRTSMFHFIQSLKTIKATTFLISEMTLDSPNYSQYDEDFLVDGIINLKLHELLEVGFQLRVMCPKMRRMPTTRAFNALEFSEDSGFLATKVIPRMD